MFIRLNPGITDSSANKPILLYDGFCGLCTRVVQFVLRREKKPGRLRFSSLQGDLGKTITDQLPEKTDSFVMVLGDRAYIKSAAALRLLEFLEPPFSYLRFLKIVPTRLLDVFYGFVSRVRYRFFGRREKCFIPKEGLSHRFVVDPYSMKSRHTPDR